jgi:CheY-like chemotaxis protein
VLDHWLPAVTGLDILKWLRHHEVHAEMPVVVFTASHDVSHEATARALAETVQLVLQEVIHRPAVSDVPESDTG